MKFDSSKKLFKTNIFVEGLLFLIISGTVFCYSLYEQFFGNIDYTLFLSPFLFPFLISICVLCISIVFIVRGIKICKNSETAIANKKNDVIYTSNKNLVYVYAVFFAVLLLSAILPLIHFIPYGIILIALLLFLMNERRLTILIIMPIISSFVLWFLFDYILGVMLP